MYVIYKQFSSHRILNNLHVCVLWVIEGYNIDDFDHANCEIIKPYVCNPWCGTSNATPFPINPTTQYQPCCSNPNPKPYPLPNDYLIHTEICQQMTGKTTLINNDYAYRLHQLSYRKYHRVPFISDAAVVCNF